MVQVPISDLTVDGKWHQMNIVCDKLIPVTQMAFHVMSSGSASSATLEIDSVSFSDTPAVFGGGLGE